MHAHTRAGGDRTAVPNYRHQQQEEGVCKHVRSWERVLEALALLALS